MFGFAHKPRRELTAGERLARRRADTPEGQRIVNKACDLSRQYPDLDEGELIRLAYWGTTQCL